MSSESRTIREIVEQLQQEGLVAATTLFEIRNAQTIETDQASTPWYVRVLIGLSAWIAAILFLVFLFGTEIITSEKGAMVVGAIFIVLTITFRWLLDHLFTNQLFLALSIAGQILLLVGFGQTIDTDAITAIVMLMLELLLIGLYRDTVHRFLSTAASVAAAVSVFYILDIPDLIHLLILLAAIGTRGLWQHESVLISRKFQAFVKPVGYGVTVALLGMLVPSILPDFPVNTWWISALGLMMVLLMGEHTILAFHRIYTIDRLSLVIYIGTLLLTLPLLMAPGILAALLILILGFHRGNRILVGLALVGLVVFLIAFYYHLALTLLVKSGILVASGGLLLLVRVIINTQFKTVEPTA